MTSVEEDEDNFAEDECTMEFGEEDPPPAAPSGFNSFEGPRFTEYPGEDFSKYLPELTPETPDYSLIIAPGQTGRRGKSKSSERPGLQDFTFADSKSGSMTLAQREQEAAAQVCDVCRTLSNIGVCLLYTSPSPRDGLLSRMPSSA